MHPEDAGGETIFLAAPKGRGVFWQHNFLGDFFSEVVFQCCPLCCRPSCILVERKGKEEEEEDEERGWRMEDGWAKLDRRGIYI